MNIALIITAYNRPQYLKKCFDSLKKVSFKENVSIYIVDDASDSETIGLCREFHLYANNNQVETYLIEKVKNSGIKDSIKRGVECAIKDGCDIIINIDGDAILKPDAFNRLVELKQKHPNNIISGFNHVSANNPNVFEREDHYLKHFCNGINMCFDKPLYEKYIKPALEVHGNWDYNTSVNCKKDSVMFVVTKPSVVQHIGFDSSMGHYSEKGPDIAQDFKQLYLPDVTLFGIDAHDPKGIVRAAEICQRDVEFGAVKIITERLFQGREGYSDFIINKLHEHFDTSHCLVIHADGYIMNWEAWDDKWLQLDLIGASWWYKDNKNVGNGGFTLRSKYLQQLLPSLNVQDTHPEDHVICRVLREQLEREHNVKFASEEVANRFSIEGFNTPDHHYRGQFGFHGYKVDFDGSDVPKFIRPVRPQSVVAPARDHHQPGRFIPSQIGEPYADPNEFPNFIPKRFRPTGNPIVKSVTSTGKPK